MNRFHNRFLNVKYADVAIGCRLMVWKEVIRWLGNPGRLKNHFMETVSPEASMIWNGMRKHREYLCSVWKCSAPGIPVFHFILNLVCL